MDGTRDINSQVAMVGEGIEGWARGSAITRIRRAVRVVVAGICGRRRHGVRGGREWVAVANLAAPQATYTSG